MKEEECRRRSVTSVLHSTDCNPFELIFGERVSQYRMVCSSDMSSMIRTGDRCDLSVDDKFQQYKIADEKRGREKKEKKRDFAVWKSQAGDQKCVVAKLTGTDRSYLEHCTHEEMLSGRFRRRDGEGEASKRGF